MPLANVLRALADLAPAGPPSEWMADVTAKGDALFAWLGDDVSPVQIFDYGDDETVSVIPHFLQDRQPIGRLRATDALHREEQLLRAGWLWLCGPARVGSTVRRVCMPLLQRPIRLERRLLQTVIDPIGDAEVGLPMVGGEDVPLPYFGVEPEPGPRDTDPSVLERFMEPDVPQYRRDASEVAMDERTRAWIKGVLAAAGIQPVGRILAGVEDLGPWRDGAELVAVVGTGLFMAATPNDNAIRASLLEWADVDGIGSTALAHLYGLTRSAPSIAASTAAAAPEDAPEPLPLTAAQSAVVARSRTEPIVVVSGAPGNGKSHTVCAIAVDAVAHGRSVLVATPSPYAGEVLGGLLARQPGPAPVLFGEAARRRRMIAALEAMAAHTVPDDELHRRRDAMRRARAERQAAEAVVAGALERERRGALAARWTPRLPELRSSVPGAFLPGADLGELQRRVDAVRERATWWRRRRLRKLAGCAGAAVVETVGAATEAAGDVRAALELDAAGGTAIGPAWEALFTAEAEERSAEGSFVDGQARAAGRWQGDGRRAVAALLTALPAARSARKNRLADLDADALVRALPLWVGTLRDAEALLPARVKLFDLVVVDEAAQVDQFRAAGALLRAERAVVVGDPRQLRHVSFVADLDVDATLDYHGVTGLADRLDVRRQSLFDVAAGAAEVTFLDEHFRSVPHLIEFSARRFYDDRVKVATRNPMNETEDAIDVLEVPDVPGEVAGAVDLVAALVANGQVGIGVITPFRAHADALEAAILARFPPEVIESHGLRTGTAHSAQGSERDYLIVALGLAPDDPPARWRFAEDPNLFNVLVTRGRRRVTIVTALTPGEVPRGIVADYLHHAEHPPAPPTTTAPTGSWTASLAAELRRNGVPVRVAYPVGTWQVDICAGAGDGAVALDCVVHPDGPAAHVARHRTLRRAGWRVVDAFASRWDGDAAAAAVELATSFRPAGGHP